MQEILKTNIRFLKGVGEKRALLFEKLGVHTFFDLLNLFPRRYIDYSQFDEIAYSSYDENCVVKATVLHKDRAVRISNNRKIFKVICADETARLTLTYFNAEYTVNSLIEGQEYLFYGKLGGALTNRTMAAPVFISANEKITQQPIYHLTAGLSGNIIRNTIKTAFSYIKEIEDFVPQAILDKYEFVDLYTALHDIHFSTSNQDLEKAKERLIFNEFLLLQLGLSLIGDAQKKITSVKVDNINITEFIESLPYTPTNAQYRAIQEILFSFKEPYAMNRLLQGDVGSGKTLVGVASMYCMAKNHIQSCMMAPTEILANQHYKSVSKMLEKFNIKVALLTSSTKAKEKREILAGLISGEIDVLIGTHAVLNDKVEFSNLGFAITDEQHRFGVKQRNKMSQKGDNPHILVMSATPIPRTLAMIIYGNMQISVIDEMPQGRKKIDTFLVGSDKRDRMFGFIDKHVKEGSQVYIVLPAIEESENLQVADMQNVTNYYNEVIMPRIPHIKTGILHGKMSAKEKDEIMDKFSKGELDLLCSTTVVEVGVDVPNSVLMIIENAERYGLSALHQLRGRVGRGEKQSYCILVSDSKSSNARQRLKFMCSTQNGFDISQFDLENRGPGDFFGNRQHGLPSLKLAQLSDDLTILNQALEVSGDILAYSSDLSAFPNIKQEIDRLFENVTL